MAERQSVDLHNQTVSIECLRLADWEQPTQDTSEQEVTENAGADAAADRTREMLVALTQIAEKKPTACVVLLLSSIGRHSDNTIARILQRHVRRVQDAKSWLRSKYPAMAKCCTSR